MSTNFSSSAPQRPFSPSRLVPLTVVICTLALGACAGVTPHYASPEIKSVSLHENGDPFMTPAGPLPGKVRWTLYTW
jgi:hypothetical protein